MKLSNPGVAVARRVGRACPVGGQVGGVELGGRPFRHRLSHVRLVRPSPAPTAAACGLRQGAAASVRGDRRRARHAAGPGEGAPGAGPGARGAGPRGRGPGGGGWGAGGGGRAGGAGGGAWGRGCRGPELGGRAKGAGAWGPGFGGWWLGAGARGPGAGGRASAAVDVPRLSVCDRPQDNGARRRWALGQARRPGA